VLGMFAPGARLPMWPAALPEYVAVAPDATASAEWHDEIAASGLEEQRPWDSLLRLLTLCGCACIAFAMIRAAAPAREPSRLRVMRVAPALNPDLEAYFDPAIRGDL
jgi:hypothetical protein